MQEPLPPPPQQQMAFSCQLVDKCAAIVLSFSHNRRVSCGAADQYALLCWRLFVLCRAATTTYTGPGLICCSKSVPAMLNSMLAAVQHNCSTAGPLQYIQHLGRGIQDAHDAWSGDHPLMLIGLQLCGM